MKKRVISFMMSAVLTMSGLGCYGLANVHAETDTNVERKLKIFAHYAEAEKPILDYAISKVQEKYPVSFTYSATSSKLPLAESDSTSPAFTCAISGMSPVAARVFNV